MGGILDLQRNHWNYVSHYLNHINMTAHCHSKSIYTYMCIQCTISPCSYVIQQHVSWEWHVTCCRYVRCFPVLSWCMLHEFLRVRNSYVCLPSNSCTEYPVHELMYQCVQAKGWVNLGAILHPKYQCITVIATQNLQKCSFLMCSTNTPCVLFHVWVRERA